MTSCPPTTPQFQPMLYPWGRYCASIIALASESSEKVACHSSAVRSKTMPETICSGTVQMPLVLPPSIGRVDDQCLDRSVREAYSLQVLQRVRARSSVHIPEP